MDVRLPKSMHATQNTVGSVRSKKVAYKLATLRLVLYSAKSSETRNADRAKSVRERGPKAKSAGIRPRNGAISYEQRLSPSVTMVADPSDG